MKKINRYTVTIKAHLNTHCGGVSKATDTQLAVLDAAKELDRILEQLHVAAESTKDMCTTFIRSIEQCGIPMSNPAAYSSINDLLRLQGEHDAAVRGFITLCCVVFGETEYIDILNTARMKVG